MKVTIIGGGGWVGAGTASVRPRVVVVSQIRLLDPNALAAALEPTMSQLGR